MLVVLDRQSRNRSMRPSDVAATRGMLTSATDSLTQPGFRLPQPQIEAQLAENPVAPDALPDFQNSLLLSRGSLNAADLSECHGVLCGMICRGRGAGVNDFLSSLEVLQLGAASGSHLHAVMEEIFHSTQQQLADAELRFQLWLPDDDQPLEERTLALGQWCTGFLAGFGLGGALQSMSEEALEALEDVRQIARAGFDTGAEEPGANEAAEDDEQAFSEIVEYVRVVTLILREEHRGPGVDDPIH